MAVELSIRSSSPKLLSEPPNSPKPQRHDNNFKRSVEDLTTLSKEYVKNLEENEAVFKKKFEIERDSDLLKTAVTIGLIFLALVTAAVIGFTLPWSIAVIPVALLAVLAFSAILTVRIETNSDTFNLLQNLRETKRALKPEMSEGYTDRPFFKFIHTNFISKLQKPHFRAIDLIPMYEIFQIKEETEKQQKIADLFLKLQHYQ